MKRREFIKKAALTGAATIGMPYILPTGRLFAASGNRLANHVVLVLFAGGVRNIESMQKADGNLMPYSINGTEAISSDIIGGMSPIPVNTGSTLQDEGTLFKHVTYREGPTGHFNGHTTVITGNYTNNNIQLRQPPFFPTVFELYRKHNSPSMAPTNCWWVTNSLGPYPYLNYSQYEGYGAAYGANMIQPSSIFRGDASEAIRNPKEFTDNDKSRAALIREFMDSQFSSNTLSSSLGVINSPNDRKRIEDFIFRMAQERSDGLHNNLFGIGSSANGDVRNVFYATKILEEFEPELLVVNMQGIDVCHSNFTAYCDNIRKSDFAMKALWDAIQAIPGMADDTVLIAIPEHGRNLNPNTIQDAYGRYALDHTNDEMSRQVFTLIAGPAGVVEQGQEFSNEFGESVDIVPTVARVLGFDNEIPSGILPGRSLEAAFV